MLSPSMSRRSSALDMPSWVLLRYSVPVFRCEEKVQELEILGRAKEQPIAGDEDDMATRILRAIKLDAHLVHPPEISTLSLRVDFSEVKRNIAGGVVSVEDNLIVITLHAIKGCDRPRYFLVHDATKNSLSLIPDNTKKVAGQGLKFTYFPVALRLDDCSYALAKLGYGTWFGPQPQGLLPMSGVLFQWSSTSLGKWTSTNLPFHPHMRPPSRQWSRGSFNADMSFTFEGKAFWVDLLFGAVFCDLRSVTELRFVGLPPECECASYIRGVPKAHRTMGCVGDSIRFINISDLNGGQPDEEDPQPSKIVVNTWTLSLDQGRWDKDYDMTLALPKLWKSESFKQRRLPQSVPKFPVLSPSKDGLVYFLLGDYYLERHVRMLSRGEFLINVDMRRKTLISCSHLPLSSGLYKSYEEPKELSPGVGFYPVIPSICGGMFSWDGKTVAKAAGKKRKHF